MCIWCRVHPWVATRAIIDQIVVYWENNANILSLSTPSFWEKPQATNLALYFSTLPSAPCLIMYNHFEVTTDLSFDLGTVTHHLWVVCIGENFPPRWSSTSSPLQPQITWCAFSLPLEKTVSFCSIKCVLALKFGGEARIHEISKTHKLFMEIPPNNDLVRLLTSF